MKMTTLYCDNCDKEFEREQVNPNKNQFCCKDCFMEYSKKNRKGWFNRVDTRDNK